MLDYLIRLRAAKESKLLSDFALSLIKILEGPYAPKFDILDGVYELYVDFCNKHEEISVSKIRLFKIFRLYGMPYTQKTIYNSNTKQESADPNTYYRGLFLNKNKLLLMSKELAGFNKTSGLTMVYIGSEPHYVTFTIVPVNAHLAKVLKGRTRAS